nr:Uncharacterised protein [Streptococcus thermophilus]
MRKFRNAALAGATAMALTFSGTSVAMAETEQQAPAAETGTSEKTTNSGSSVEHLIGKNIFQTDKGTEATGEDIFGQKNWDQVPFSWKLLYGSTWALGIVAAIALVAGPIDNFIKYGPFAK